MRPKIDRTKPPAFFGHVRARLPDYAFATIFDVGANVGQSCVAFSRAAPKAKIYAFEPVKQTFDILAERTSAFENITAVNLALGRTVGTASMRAVGTSTGNRIVADGTRASNVSIVTISTAAAFMEENGIERLSFLKIDTEGHDLAVIEGLGDVLARVDFIQVEASMNPDNNKHVAFQRFFDLLTPRGFKLFHIYEQTFEFTDGGKPWLRRSNLVFIRAALAVGG